MPLAPSRPWPKVMWLLVALAIPTCYVTLAGVTGFAWMVCGLMFPLAADTPAWLDAAIRPALYVGLALWPIHIVWAGLSSQLVGREKRVWLFLVIGLHVVGMPAFLFFMARRYLGLEPNTLRRDESALDAFLQHCGVARASLTETQADVLRAYCRRRREWRIYAWVMIPLSAFGLFFSAVIMPDALRRLNVGQTPVQLIVVDSAKHTRREIGGSPEAQRLFIDNVLLEGAYVGVTGSQFLFILINTLMQAWGSPDRKTLIAFLRAAHASPAN